MTRADLLTMPISEKIQLMESLWESLSNDTVSAIPSWHSDVLTERRALLDQGKESITDWSDAKQRIRDQIAKQ